MEVTVNELLEKLKMQFYDWCTSLPLDEIASNEKLVAYVERFERLLVGKVGGGV
jgi:hypothetical protein